MLSKDLIAVRRFPAVVQAADIATLRAGKAEDALRDFIGGYLGFDERSHHALSTSLHALTATQRGGAFFLNGVFGSGKSHLLGLLTLLCDGIGHQYFLETHPQFTETLNRFPRFFAVQFSLDEYDASRFSLEEIVHREIEKEWNKRFNESLELPQSGTRGEYFQALEEALSTRGFERIFLGIDELSLFLSAKDHKSLQADAAFLQFLGQRAARKGLCPLVVFAALQKTVEDIGDLEAYSLSQIRDRFVTLQLSLAHIPSLISHRLIVVRDEPALQSVCRDSYDQLSKALPLLDFGREEWRQLYPFHPATVALLEQVVVRFFSRTRSAALFCAHAAEQHLNRDASAYILPDELFDYIAPELNLHPDLRQLAQVWKTWQQALDELAHDANEKVLLMRLMKTLLLFKIAGSAPNVMQLANAIALDANLGGERNYEYAKVLLERLRTRASFLAIERNDGVWQDRYSVDMGTRVSELARRHVKNTLHELQIDDTRIAQYVLSCCRDEPLPLATLSRANDFTVMWRNAQRVAGVELLSHSSAHAVNNRATLLLQPGTREDFLLLIHAPFNCRSEQSTLAELSPDERVRAAVVVWSPRKPTDDEKQFAREATSTELLLSDPQLLDNRRGRAILEHLQSTASAQRRQAAQVATRLLREGILQSTDGVMLEAGELALGDTWQSTLEAVAEFCLPRVYDRFEEIAPRARVLTPSNTDTLCLEILRRPADEPYFAASHERIVRALCEPLGIARADRGRWRITTPRDDLKQELLQLVTNENAVSLAQLDAYFAKSQWGLKSEQLALVLCSLLRTGELTALDTKSQTLPPTQIGMPLRRAVHMLQTGALLNEEHWRQAQSEIEILTGEMLGERSFENQQRAKVLLSAWKEDTLAQIELAGARLHQLQRVLKHDAAQWQNTNHVLQQVDDAQKTISTNDLQSVLAFDACSLIEILKAWRNLLAALDQHHAEILTAYALLSNPALSVPAQLADSRGKILQRFADGEAILQDDELIQRAVAWCEEYFAEYREWHNAQHNRERWNSLRRVLHSDAFRALELLGTLQSRQWPQAKQIETEIDAELCKQCPRDGTLLPGEAACNACNLRYGARVLIGDSEHFVGQQEQALASFHEALRKDSVRDFLSRHEGASELLAWNGESSRLLPLLSQEVLLLLENAFKPRRRVVRSLQSLESAFASCRTTADYQRAFQQWLDGTDTVGSDDEIEVVD